MPPEESESRNPETLPTLKQRQRQWREEAILELAHKVMATQGYLAMTMDDLASRLGISTGTLYQHFASKEELAVGVAVQQAEAKRAFIESQDPSLPAIQRLKEFLRWNIERRFRYEWPDIEAIISVVRSHSKQRPDLQHKMDQHADAIARLVDLAKEQGDIRADVVTPVLVQLLIKGISGSGLDRLLAEEHCTLDDLSDSLIKILLDGLRVPQ